MSWKYLKFLVLAYLMTYSKCLITKNFEKIKVKSEHINNFTELASIPQMDFFECSYFCMKKDKDCKSFYITKDGSCRQVPLNQHFIKASPSDPNAASIYSTEPIKFCKP